jgi:hypothetical protein
MNTFVELIKAIAWPVTVIWLGYLFRADLRLLLSRVSTLKYKDVEANFGKKLSEAERKAENIIDSTPLNNESDITLKEQLLRIAEISPRAAVVEAWTLIETAAMRNGLWSGDAIKRTNPRIIIEHLSKSGKFSKESLELINELRQIRNRASHLPDFAISQSEAERYLELAAKSAAVIDAIAS